jgi:signal transduction histidine kinase
MAISEVLPGSVYTAIIRDISLRKELEREITEIAAAEQRRIGQELHDGVGQELTALRMMATVVKRHLQEGSAATEPLLNRVLDGLQNVQEQVRRVSHGLVPVDLDASGLHAALSELAGRVKFQAGVQCTFHAPQRILVNDALTATNLYHIVQEATNNALRHGRPRRIDIRMDARTGALVLSIQDDGSGLPEEGDRQNGIGLRLMRHRASLIGGVLSVLPAEGRGTVVTCTLPGHCGQTYM